MKMPLTFDPDLEHIKDADGKVVCHFGPSDFDWSSDAVHAAEIVAACNAREALVAVAEAICDVMSTPSNEEYWPKLAALTPKANAALAQLKT